MIHKKEHQKQEEEIYSIYETGPMNEILLDQKYPIGIL
jgi:hypothetical protein